MQIAGRHSPQNIEDIIAQLQTLGSGFAERTEYTGHYVSRGESETLRAKIEASIDDNIRHGISNPLSLNMKPVVANAHRVEGGEVGFSATDPIGTDNTHDCVTVMLRDPITKKTALAHIGGDTTEESLQLLWSGMTQSGAPIEMRLLGGRQLPVTASEGTDEYSYQMKNNQIARWNVEKVARFFKDKPVNVLSADILSADQPAVVVVDPATFSIEEKVPGRENPNAFVNGLSVLYTGDYLKESSAGHNPLMKAFDLTVSPERNPVQLTPQQLARLGEFMASNREQITDYFQRKGRSGIWLEQAVERAEALREAARTGLIASDQAQTSTIEPPFQDVQEAAVPRWSNMPRNLPGRTSAGRTPFG